VPGTFLSFWLQICAATGKIKGEEQSSVQKVVRMRIFLLLVVFTSFFSSHSKADLASDTADGNLIAEPILSDYSKAERTPGFSPITDIVDQDGK